MRRILALALAVAMVAAALFIRDRIDDDDDGGDGGPGASNDGGDELGLIVCVPELEAACAALEAAGAEVRVEEAGVTADALAAEEADLDGWLTLAPWPAMVEDTLSRGGRSAAFADPAPPPLGRTPIVLVGVAGRLAELGRACADPDPYWRCVGDRINDPVRPAHDPADRSATGLLVVGSAVVDYFGEAAVSSNDFQDPEFQSWFTRLERSTTFDTNFDSLFEHLLVRPSTFNAVGGLEAAAVAEGARREGYSILYPAPMATADAVLVWAPGRETDRFDDDVRAALAEGGWRAPDDGDLPEANGLPGPGVMVALRQLWSDVAR